MGALLLQQPPVHDVGQQVVVPQPVLCVHLLVVHRQGTVQDAPFLWGEDTSSFIQFMWIPSELEWALTYSSTGWALNSRANTSRIFSPTQRPFVKVVKVK